MQHRLLNTSSESELQAPNKMIQHVYYRELDALIVDVKPKDAPFDIFEWDAIEQRLEKFFNLGDCRNISKVFVKGRLVH